MAGEFAVTFEGDEGETKVELMREVCEIEEVTGESYKGLRIKLWQEACKSCRHFGECGFRVGWSSQEPSDYIEGGTGVVTVSLTPSCSNNKCRDVNRVAEGYRDRWESIRQISDAAITEAALDGTEEGARRIIDAAREGLVRDFLS